MSKKVEDAIVALLIERAPNFVSVNTVVNRVAMGTCEEVLGALESLWERDLIEKLTDPREQTGYPEDFFRLKNLRGIPIRTHIRVGDIDVPRLMSDSRPNLLPEIFNESVERLAEYANSLEKRFNDIVQKELRQYWSSFAGVVGVMIAVFSLIIVGLPRIETDATLGFWDIVLMNTAQLLPIALVLAVFVLALRWVVK
jgi:hypothetical protein